MKKVILCAGHGAGDPGAVSQDGRYTEAALAVRMRDTVAAQLRTRGVDVIEDGADGENQPLKTTLNYLRNTRQAIAVELHFNAATSRTATGIEALSLPGLKLTSRALAKAVSSATGLQVRGDQGWKPDSAGQHHRLAFCRAGGVILELCFISNPADLKAYLANESRVAVALADCLERLARA